jgi:hypothetical protein
MNSDRAERRLAAILATDVAGYSRLTGKGGVVFCDILMVHGHTFCVPRLR